MEKKLVLLVFFTLVFQNLFAQECQDEELKKRGFNIVETQQIQLNKFMEITIHEFIQDGNTAKDGKLKKAGKGYIVLHYRDYHENENSYGMYIIEEFSKGLPNYDTYKPLFYSVLDDFPVLVYIEGNFSRLHLSCESITKLNTLLIPRLLPSEKDFCSDPKKHNILDYVRADRISKAYTCNFIL